MFGDRLKEICECNHHVRAEFEFIGSILKNQIQLITYVDRLAGELTQLERLLDGALSELFGGVHLLPFFTPIDGSDAGFDPIDHTEVDARLGSWGDVRSLSKKLDLIADLIVNHVSSDSPQFRDFSERGHASRFATMFLTHGRVFPEGSREEDLLRIYRPRPGLPFTSTALKCGEKHLLWTTFTPRQIDIDVLHAEGRAYLTSILDRFHSAGIRMIRLDAAGYAVKKPGTSCFMIPETFQFIAELTSQARALGMEVLVEIHSHYLQQVQIAKQVDCVYDFALPPLVLHTLFSKDATALSRWLNVRPHNCVTVLDTHDGIGVIDVGAGPGGEAGLLPPDDIDRLVETIHARSNGQSRMATGAAANNLDLYQVNCTFFDALGCRENEYLIARAIQFFVPGIPQVYYVGLFAGTNDTELLARSRIGRDINRHYYTPTEIQASLDKPVVRRLMNLMRLRNSHPAFSGNAEVETSVAQRLSINWKNAEHWAKLAVDLDEMRAVVTYSNPRALHEIGTWDSNASSAVPEVMR